MNEESFRIPISRGLVASVDAADYERVMAMGLWSAEPSGDTFYARKVLYRPGDRKRTSLMMHTFITGWSYVDHIDGDGLNNRGSNLRQATHAQNMHNKRLYRNNTSGFKGVTRNTGKGRPWSASIKWNKRSFRLGNYDTPEEAALAYDRAARRWFGEFARPNFPAPGSESGQVNTIITEEASS